MVVLWDCRTTWVRNFYAKGTVARLFLSSVSRLQTLSSLPLNLDSNLSFLCRNQDPCVVLPGLCVLDRGDELALAINAYLRVLDKG